MPIPQRYERLVQRLQAKSNGGKVSWVDNGRYQSFRCELGRFRVRIEKTMDGAIELGIADSGSDMRGDDEEIDGFCIDAEFNDGWETLNVLHTTARRQAYEVDKVLSEMRTELEAL